MLEVEGVIDEILGKYLPNISNNPILEDEMYEELSYKLNVLLIERKLLYPFKSLFTKQLFIIKYCMLVDKKSKQYK